MHGAHNFSRNCLSMFSANQQILRNPKFHYSVQNSLLLELILTQINPVHNLIFHFETYFNIIFPPTARSAKRTLPVFLFRGWTMV